MKILIIEDDPDLVELLTFMLARAGFEVQATADHSESLRHVQSGWPDLVLLDLNLGSWHGLSFLREVEGLNRVPVIILTAHGSEDEKVQGLDAGAIDYVTKPFSHRELTARIRAHLRNSGASPVDVQDAPAGSILRAGPISIDVAQHSAYKADTPLRLTLTEFRLLHYLVSHTGTVATTESLLEQVWGYRHGGESDIVRVAVHRLRQKVEDDPTHPMYIQTVPGLGFLFTA